LFLNETKVHVYSQVFNKIIISYVKDAKNINRACGKNYTMFLSFSEMKTHYANKVLPIWDFKAYIT